MGISLDRGSRIAGYKPATFKNALIGYSRTGDPGRLVDLKSVFHLRRDGAIVFEECVDRALIDAETLKLTEQGEVFARAKAQNRAPLEKADRILAELLERADSMNADDEAVHQVDEIWLFGSLMRREATVGDIDLAIVTSRKERFASDHAMRKVHIEAQVARFIDAPSRWQFPWEQEGWLERRALFGPRRHPLLAGAQNGTSDLASLGIPCRLIYDRNRGGGVNDPILDKHPASHGRDEHLAPPAEMPDLTPAPLRPMDGRWVAGYSKLGNISPFDIFRGWTEDAHRLFPGYPEHLRVFGDNHELHSFPWKPKRLKRKGLDGRASLAIVNATEWSGTSIVLQRQIHTSSDEWVLQAGFSDVQLHRSRKYVDPFSIPPIVSVIALILAVDAERMLRRAIESPTRPKVAVHISPSDLSEDLTQSLAVPIYENLRSRAVYIEPPGAGSAVSVSLGNEDLHPGSGARDIEISA